MLNLVQVNNDGMDELQDRLDRLLLDLNKKQMEVSIVEGEIIALEREKEQLGVTVIAQGIWFFGLTLIAIITAAASPYALFFIANIILVIVLVPIIITCFGKFILSVKKYIENRETAEGSPLSKSPYTLTNRIKNKKISLHKLRVEIENDIQMISHLKEDIIKRENKVSNWY